MPIGSSYPAQGSIFLTMLWFFCFVIWMMLLFSVIGDNFRRDDHGGWAKAGWVVLWIILPIFGILIYMIVRPKNTPQDQAIAAEMQRQQLALQNYSPADEIKKLNDLKASGAITDEEYTKMKANLTAPV